MRIRLSVSESGPQFQHRLGNHWPYSLVSAVTGPEIVYFATQFVESTVRVETDHWLAVLEDEPITKLRLQPTVRQSVRRMFDDNSRKLVEPCLSLAAPKSRRVADPVSALPLF